MSPVCGIFEWGMDGGMNVRMDASIGCNMDDMMDGRKDVWTVI